MFMTALPGYNSTIQNSAIHDCNGICFSADTASKVKVDNNVIYNGKKFLI